MDISELEIRLARIREEKRESSFNYWEILRYKGSPINVGLTTQITPEIDNDLLMLKLGVRYTTVYADVLHNLLHYVVSFDFDIKNLSKEILLDKGSVKVPVPLLHIILSVGIGTLRGMLAQRTHLTMLDKYPLPILNINEIIDNMCANSSASDRFAPMYHFEYE